jgi:hypothetical protein
MAASVPGPQRRRRLVAPILLALLAAFGPPRCEAAGWGESRFSAWDLLPRRLAWSLMGDTVHSALDLLPTFVAFAAPGGPAAAWRGACFAENEAVLTLTPGPGGRNGTGAGIGGAVLRLKVPLHCPALKIASISQCLLTSFNFDATSFFFV